MGDLLIAHLAEVLPFAVFFTEGDLGDVDQELGVDLVLKTGDDPLIGGIEGEGARFPLGFPLFEDEVPDLVCIIGGDPLPDLGALRFRYYKLAAPPCLEIEVFEAVLHHDFAGFPGQRRAQMLMVENDLVIGMDRKKGSRGGKDRVEDDDNHSDDRHLVFFQPSPGILSEAVTFDHLIEFIRCYHVLHLDLLYL